MERKLKDMTQISVTENENNKNNLYYVQSSLAEIFSQAGCSVNVIETDKRCILNINCPEQYKDIIKMEVGDKIVTIGGIVGKITSLKDDEIVIETGSPAEKSYVKFQRSAVREVLKAAPEEK